MASIKDDRGYNQGFAPSKSTNARLDRRTQWILGEMQHRPGIRILEIGCGTGEVAHWMAERTEGDVVGSDLCVPFIEEARKNFSRVNLSYEVVDFNDPAQIPDASFDYVVGNGILHHLYYHLDDALKNIRRILKPGGKMIFLEPNLQNPYVYLIFSFPWLRKLSNLEPDEMAFSRSYINTALARAGFKNIHTEFRDFLLPGIPASLIAPSIWIGDILEKIPVLRSVTQSLFIRAENDHA